MHPALHQGTRGNQGCAWLVGWPAYPRVSEIQLVDFALGNAITSPPLLPPIAAEIVAPIVSTARRIGSAFQMSISRGGRGLAVPEKFADDRQAQRGTSADRRKAVSKVMDAQAFEPGRGCDRGPRLLEVRSRCALILAGDNVQIATDPWQRRQDPKGGGRQKDGFPPGLRGRQVHQPALEVDILPLCGKDFSKASPRQDQEPIAAIANGSSLRRRFSGFGACFAFGFASSTV
jgi:hypothetical protein